MLEIIILFLLGRKIAQMANDRGRSAWPWVIMLVLFWYGGAFGAAILTAIAMAAANPNQPPGDEDMFIFLGAALGGAICGAIFTFVVVSMLPAVPDEYDDEDDYDRLPSRSRRRYDDEDEDGRRARSNGDDPPRRRRHYEDEEDDYDRPRRRYDD